MPEDYWGESDHDRGIRLDVESRHQKEELEMLKGQVELLMADRAKLIGWCVGVSGAVGIIVKVFWPGKV